MKILSVGTGLAGNELVQFDVDGASWFGAINDARSGVILYTSANRALQHAITDQFVSAQFLDDYVFKLSEADLAMLRLLTEF